MPDAGDPLAGPLHPPPADLSNRSERGPRRSVPGPFDCIGADRSTLSGSPVQCASVEKRRNAHRPARLGRLPIGMTRLLLGGEVGVDGSPCRFAAVDEPVDIVAPFVVA